ncbi:MAG: glycosyltransferase, partial [Lachnospiraceae bacterium]|nr:glycosyltransferase [Lachnospiraceae bacterium]
MRIIQMLPVFTVGDAIGNDVVAVYGILKELGYETHIYAEIIDERLKACDPKDYRLYEDREDDIILYHLSTGSALNTIVCRYKAHLIVVYHNITPPGFMEGWNMEAARSCSKGLRAARYMAKKAEYVIADSEYNLNELRSMGYDCGGRVLPILIPFSDYD